MTEWEIIVQIGVDDFNRFSSAVVGFVSCNKCWVSYEAQGPLIHAAGTLIREAVE
jgi:hypothetical protein